MVTNCSTRTTQVGLQSLQTESQLEMCIPTTCLSNTAFIASEINVFGTMGKALDCILDKLSFLNNSEIYLCQLEYICTLKEVCSIQLRTLKGNAVSHLGNPRAWQRFTSQHQQFLNL